MPETNFFKRKNREPIQGDGSLALRLKEEVGSGSYGKVYRAERCDAEDRRDYAAKVISIDKAPKDFLDKFLPRELVICQKLKHPNIVRTHDVINTSNKVVMIMDYAPKGDLLSYCRLRGPLVESAAQKLFKQIADGLHYLHENKIIHRDLKCENILIGMMNQCQIADFGFAREMDGVTSKTFCGSAAYAAPELLKGREYTSFGADIWSLGCILFIMLTHRMPFKDDSIAIIIKEHKNNLPPPLPMEIDRVTSLNAKSILGDMLTYDSSSRIEMEDIVKLDWVAKANEESTLIPPVRKINKRTSVRSPS